ncbi:MAG: RNA polymerase sigma factor [Myxococcota bacterium]|nr:RNA polymerase sigma factor [Myxococcota bacterium]
MRRLEPIPFPIVTTELSKVAASPDVLSIHEQHAEFVWLSLQRLGVPRNDVEDLLQEVFVVVHKRLSSFDGSARMTTWLYGICLRVASTHRRRAYRRHEHIVAQVPEGSTLNEASPEVAAVSRQAQERLQSVLDGMDLEKRALLVMYELDELPCEEIAEMLSIPVGTVYSRLHVARKAFQEAMARLQTRERMRQPAQRRGPR